MTLKLIHYEMEEKKKKLGLEEENWRERKLLARILRAFLLLLLRITRSFCIVKIFYKMKFCVSERLCEYTL